VEIKGRRGKLKRQSKRKRKKKGGKSDEGRKGN
jgi:hypothetical protein